jgi:hypothetical protein
MSLRNSGSIEEADETEAYGAKVIENIASGQYDRPVLVVSFNPAEGWSRDVPEDIANEIVERALRNGEQLTRPAHEFVDRLLDEDVPISIAAALGAP